MTSALEGTFGRLPFDNWIFDRLPYTDLATKTIPPPDHAKVTTRSGTMKRKKAEEEERKSKKRTAMKGCNVQGMLNFAS